MIGVVPLGIVGVVNASTYLLGLVLVLSATASLATSGDERPPRRSFHSGLSEGLALVWRMPWLVLGIASSAFYQLLFLPTLFVLGPGYTHESMENGSIAWGAAMGTMGVGSLVGGIVAGRWRAVRAATSSVALLAVTPIATITLALDLPLMLVLISFFLTGTATTIAGAQWMTAVIRSVDETHVSRVASVDAFGSLLFKPIGQVSVAPLAAILTASVAMLALGGATVVLQVVTSLWMRRLEPRERE